MADPNVPVPPTSTSLQSGRAALVRLGWMAAAPLAMIALAMAIAAKPAWTLGLTDALFWSSIVLTAVLRYVDITALNGETSDGRPATTQDYRSYACGLLFLAATIWTAAQAVHL